MSPIWDYFELNDVNSDEAAAAFHLGCEGLEKSIETIFFFIKIIFMTTYTIPVANQNPSSDKHVDM